MKPYCFVLFFLPLDIIYSFAVSIAALGHSDTRWAAPFVGSIISCFPVILMIVADNTLPNLKCLVWKNTVSPELNVIAYPNNNHLAAKHIDFSNRVSDGLWPLSTGKGPDGVCYSTISRATPGM